MAENILWADQGSATPVTAISHYACPASMGLTSFLDTVARYGFNGIAVTARTLEDAKPPKLLQALKDRSLCVTSVNSAGYFLFADRDARTAQTARNRELLEAAAALEAHGLNVIVGGIAHGEWTLSDARSRVVEALQEFSAYACTLGVTVLVEPIHPNAIFDKGVLNTIGQVESAIHGVTNGKMTVDIFHSWWDPDFPRVLCDPAAPVGLLQICDVAPDAAGSHPVRAAPGDGRIALDTVIATHRAHHPTVPVELELFAAQDEAYDFDAILDRTRRLRDRSDAIREAGPVAGPDR